MADIHNARLVVIRAGHAFNDEVASRVFLADDPRERDFMINEWKEHKCSELLRAAKEKDPSFDFYSFDPVVVEIDVQTGHDESEALASILPPRSVEDAPRRHVPELEAHCWNQMPKAGWRELRLYNFTGTNLYQWFGKKGTDSSRQGWSVFEDSATEVFMIPERD